VLWKRGLKSRNAKKDV